MRELNCVSDATVKSHACRMAPAEPQPEDNNRIYITGLAGTPARARGSSTSRR